MAQKIASANKSSAAATDALLSFIKAGSLLSGSKPGFAHALKLSHSFLIEESERLSVTNQNKTVTYRYPIKVKKDDTPTVSIGFFTALMDELSTHTCFTAGLPGAPGASLQMQTELLVKDLNLALLPTGAKAGEQGTDADGDADDDDGTNTYRTFDVDIVNTVIKFGKTVSHTRTDFYLATTQHPLAFSSHIKYMPTGSRIIDWVLGSKPLYWFYQQMFVSGRMAMLLGPSPSSSISRKNSQSLPLYAKKDLREEVIGSHVKILDLDQDRSKPYVLPIQATFEITPEHTNPFGVLHGGCHAMVMEHVGAFHAITELGIGSNDGNDIFEDRNRMDAVLLQSMQIDFIGAARGKSIDVHCETIGVLESGSKGDYQTIVHVRVMLKKRGRILSEGKLRFSSSYTHRRQSGRHSLGTASSTTMRSSL